MPESKLRRSFKWLRQLTRLMNGIPDYENYVQLRAVSHPGEPVMTYEQFFRDRQEARYSKRQCTTRCC
ncbi:YbdD/YjiX family protein [Pseudomonas sp. Sample_23]|uniref:YbdD/YjiX family protein n=1 Tax=Pseudomonas sp. Sample_23 TaxID=2448267 RepID=UPI001032A99D|nr:YbdD/YjiX family protein [Pseudomonas sp. Sample_23]